MPSFSASRHQGTSSTVSTSTSRDSVSSPSAVAPPTEEAPPSAVTLLTPPPLLLGFIFFPPGRPDLGLISRFLTWTVAEEVWGSSGGGENQERGGEPEGGDTQNQVVYDNVLLL